MAQPHYVQIPKDLNDIKEKFMFGLTKRQVVSFGIAALLAFPVFFLTRNILGMSGAIFAMGAVGAPAIICGIYKKNGMHFEQVMKQMFEFLKLPKKRIYSTTSVYECIDRHIEYIRLRIFLNQSEGGTRGKKKS